MQKSHVHTLHTNTYWGAFNKYVDKRREVGVPFLSLECQGTLTKIAISKKGTLFKGRNTVQNTYTSVHNSQRK